MGRQNVGMMYPVWAPLTSHTEGSMPVYGTGRVIMEARTATINYTRNNNPDYGDDRIVDEDTGISEMSMTFESTGISDEDRVAVLGEEARTTGGGQWVSDTDSPYGGFGYIRKMRDEGVYKYEAWITLKIKFYEETQNTQTREGTITWGHPQLTGRAAGLDVDGTGKLRFQLHQSFDTIAAAKEFIDDMLKIG